jgi:hypothetical protein
VPAYALYASNPQETPTLLPEVLTPGIVIEALDKLEAAEAMDSAAKATDDAAKAAAAAAKTADDAVKQ